MKQTFASKTVGVVGIARSGIACADVLQRHGARVRLFDSKPADVLLEQIGDANAIGLAPFVGGVLPKYGELDLLVTSPGVRKSAPILQGALHANVPIISEIEVGFRIASAPILAITGTNGKTTTTVVLAQMLQEAGFETTVGGNIAAGNLALPLVAAAERTSPAGVIVAEISSFQLEWIASFRPKIAALLPITTDHEDQQTWDEYVDSKWRIFENQTSDDVCVIHESLAADARLKKVRSRVIAFAGSNTTEQLGRFVDVGSIKVPGEHNRENILCAAIMAHEFGASRDAIARAAAEFAGVVHRLEYVATINEVPYINNSMCTNADAFDKSLRAVPGPKVIIMGGVFKGSDAFALVNAVQANDVVSVYLIGRSGKEFADAMDCSGFHNWEIAGSLQTAVRKAHESARRGCTVMLAPACASFDQFRDFEDRGDQFKEAVYALCQSEQEKRT